MSQKKHLSILEFSRLAGIKRENLRFYDRIGLLKPELRGENGYRYYTRRQLSSAYLIIGLRLLGVGLDDIRAYSVGRTPEKMLTLFAEQEARMQQEIEKLRENREILRQYAEMAQKALRHGDGEILLEERRRARIFLCPSVSAALDEDEGEIQAFQYAERHGVNLGSPMGIMVAQGDLCAAVPDYRYYFKTVRRGNAWKPAGLYAVAYGTSVEEEAMAFYQRLLDFIEAQGLEAAGGAYGEFLLDDLAVQEPEQHFGCIEIPVRRR